jgi:hypothetical protein
LGEIKAEDGALSDAQHTHRQTPRPRYAPRIEQPRHLLGVACDTNMAISRKLAFLPNSGASRFKRATR